MSNIRAKIATEIGKFSNSRFVRAVMDAGYSVISFTIVGAFFLILTVLPQAFPIPGFASLYAHTIGRFSNLFIIVYNSSMGILALIFTGTFAYSYTKIYRDEERINLVPHNGELMALMGLFITIQQTVIKHGVIQFVESLKRDNIIGGGIAVSDSGITRISAEGIFTGLIVAWISVQIYRFTIKHNWKIKMPAAVPSGVSDSFSALIPSICIAVVLTAINLIFVLMHTDLFSFLYIPFSFLGNIINTWWGMLIFIFLIHAMWWFGIHSIALESMVQPVALANLAKNIKGAHYIWAGDPSGAFVALGGSGATLGICIWIFFRARSAQLRQIGKVEIVPAIFNINEPFIFGTPVIYNVKLLIPWICAPMASCLTFYIGEAIHFVPKITVMQPWPTPVGLCGFLATLSWRGAVWSILCAVVAFIIWLPFIKKYDQSLYENEKLNVKVKD